MLQHDCVTRVLSFLLLHCSFTKTRFHTPHKKHAQKPTQTRQKKTSGFFSANTITKHTHTHKSLQNPNSRKTENRITLHPTRYNNHPTTTTTPPPSQSQPPPLLLLLLPFSPMQRTNANATIRSRIPPPKPNASRAVCAAPISSFWGCRGKPPKNRCANISKPRAMSLWPKSKRTPKPASRRASALYASVRTKVK